MAIKLVRRTAFQSWLKGQVHRDDVIGDLAKDAMRDHYFNAVSHSLESVIAHIKAGGHDRADAISAARLAWAEFRDCVR